MADDELNEPLGLAMAAPKESRWRKRGLWAAGGGLVCALLGTAVWLGVTAPRAGEPFAVASIMPPAAAPPSRPQDLAPRSAAAAPFSQQEPVETIENGVTVMRARTAGPDPAGPGGGRKGPMIIKVPQALGLGEVAATDPRLIEETRLGPLPKIGADGTRPSDLYARPLVFNAVNRPGAPRIAIYIGGLGLNAGLTREAINSMPPAVSLAFAPYATNLDAAVKEAKAAGHEVLLQIPMETFGDRTDQPGPHTLLAGAQRTTLIEDLHWLMSRMTGYAGITNFLGGKFTAGNAAMTALLQETGSRGLLYIDDGTSKRSLGPLLAPQLGVAAARADLVLDAVADPAALRAALVKLEAIARDKGTAVGMASGLPGNLAVIATFAAGLDAKGIALVPVSAIASLNPSNVAAAP